ncbi:protein kinase [bacterium]|nr:protein kinase [bacterium]
MIGQTIAHYRITRELGAGGMGLVYEAVDTKIDRTVAIKLLPPDLVRDREAKARFIHEAKAASSLDHPNVCTVYEIDETEDGQLFLVMARYEGETLQERIARGPLPQDEAIDIAKQVAEGLHEAHARDIVHRDIKPANIFVTVSGMVKILDFGLAKLAGQTQITQPGTRLGTVAYMSPEQVRGEEATAAADVWALGVVMHEMITGRPVFAGEHAHAILYAIQHSAPSSRAADLPGLEPHFRVVMERCLDKDVRRRYRDAAELASALEEMPGRSRPRTRRGSRSRAARAMG